MRRPHFCSVYVFSIRDGWYKLCVLYKRIRYTPNATSDAPLPPSLLSSPALAHPFFKNNIASMLTCFQPLFLMMLHVQRSYILVGTYPSQDRYDADSDDTALAKQKVREFSKVR